MVEMPLHVRIADALGWREVFHDTTLSYHPSPPEKKPSWPAEERWAGITPFTRAGAPCPLWEYVPRYDTDWSATGPLIERLGIMAHGDTGEAAHKDIREPYDFETEGPRWLRVEPLLSLCAG